MSNRRDVSVWVQEMAGRTNLYLQYIDPATGLRVSKTSGTADPDEAKAMAKDLEYKIRHNKVTRINSVHWEKFRLLYEEEVLPGLRERSQEKISTVFNVLEEVINPTSVKKLGPRTISRFVQKLRLRPRRGDKNKEKVGLAPITIRNYLVVLRSALRWARRQKFIRRVPAFPKIKVPKKKPRPIPTESFERLLAKAPDQHWKAFLLCGWYAGLRLSEAWNLRRSPTEKYPYLDLAANRIVLPAEFAKSAEDQWVPLHPLLKKALSDVGTTGDRIFILQSSIGKLLDRSGISRVVGLLAKEAGVKLTMHSLRKGFGCRMAAALGKGGAPILHEMMRHSSMQVTLDFYANIDESKQEAIGLIA